MKLIRLIIWLLFVLAVQGFASNSLMEEETIIDEEELPGIIYIYNFCNNLEEVRNFYSNLIGLTEGMYMNEPHYGCLSYQLGSLEFMFLREDDEELTVSTEFAAQPGGGGGQRLAVSWSVLVPEDSFPNVVSRLKAAGVPSNHPDPIWLQNSYWSFVVNDPAGNTVEVCTYPSERPEYTDWAE